RAYVVRNERGEAVRMVGTMIDITDLKSSEESHRFLAAASASLEETLEVNATAAAFAGLAVPGFADFALVDLLQHDGTLRRTAVAHVRPGLDRALGAGTLVEPHREVRPAPLRVVESGAIECMTGPPARDAAA